MVQPNTRIYPIPYVTEKIYSRWENNINDLAKAMRTEVKFNFAEQCFEIKGRSQQACEDTSKRLEMHLLPQLNKALDENNFVGTFEDLESMKESLSARPSPTLINTARSSKSNSPTVQSPRSANTSTTVITGRPLNLEDVDRQHAQSSTDTTTNGTNPNQEREAYYRYETESDEPESSDEEYAETFTFAKNIQDPKKVLTGPITNNTKAPDYLRIIGNDTDTECSLDGRDIKIVGKDVESIKEALSRFRNLQTMFKRSKRPTAIVPCVHYPTESPEFNLYFCALERYRYQHFVSTFQIGSPLFVMLPVFKDKKKGVFSKPKDLVDGPVRSQQPQQQMTSPPQWIQLQQQQQLSLDERMRLATLEHKRGFGNSSAGMAPDLTPLWGENKNYRVNPSATTAPGPSPPPRGTPPPQQPPVMKQPVDDFPALVSSSPKPTKQPQQTQQRRVMRISSQKVSAAVQSPPRSQLDIVREYNLHNIKTALEEGLNGIRGFKGEIKLSAKLGKVLWTNLTPEIQKQMWVLRDTKDIVMAQRGVEPRFSEMTTKYEEVMDKISEILPDRYNMTSKFEIYAEARNQPSMPYEPVVMEMTMGVVGLKRIVTKVNKVVEVDWVSLDRKMDFQLLLKTEENTRTDVKPFNTFIKKVAVDPRTLVITYENVPDFLKVTHILHKTTTMYRIHFPFVVEITRVEKIPVAQQKFNGFNIEKFIGNTGKGQVWYDMEVFYTLFDNNFKANLDLQVGKLASWTVEDILGSGEDASNALVEYIRCLLILVEKCEGALEK